jgi:hypothetical protein
MHIPRGLMLAAAGLAAAGSLTLAGSAGPAAAATDAPIGAGAPIEIVNGYTGGSHPPYCLDAQASGPLAGQDGDPVQIWHCNGTKNQEWYTGGQDGFGDYTLVNKAWPSECLNVNSNGGVHAGSLLQLWHCTVNTENEFWDVSDWEINVDQNGSAGLLSAANLQVGYFLDAIDSYPGQLNDGDLVQVWINNGHTDETWHF